jgi:hypothetical protein
MVVTTYLGERVSSVIRLQAAIPENLRANLSRFRPGATS